MSDTESMPPPDGDDPRDEDVFDHDLQSIVSLVHGQVHTVICVTRRGDKERRVEVRFALEK